MENKENKESKSFLDKVAAFIVDKRKGFYLVYIILVIFCLVSTNWVKVNNTLTDYLGDDTETKRGLTIMDEEFTTYATAEVMVDNISFEKAEELQTEIEKVKGVKEVAFDDTEKHFVDASALFSITFDGTDQDEICETALAEVEDKLSEYDLYVSAELGNSKADNIAKEINIVMIIVAVIVVSVLFLTSRTYMEVPVLLMTFVMAAILNKGTNYMFGTISFVSNSVAVVLQLALAIDYAIILCHRYTEERETHDARDAVIIALKKAIPEISGSCLTTVSGLAAMMCMHFKIGFDMGLVLIKAIFMSILCVFTLMPGLIFSFSGLIDKTHHKSFVPKIDAWGKIVIKLRYIMPAVFFVLLIAGFIFSNKCPYAYSYTNLTTIKHNDSQIAQQMIDDTFQDTNVLAVIVPKGNYEKEQKLARELEKYDEIDSVTAFAAVEALDGYCVGDRLTPRQFAELTDMDIEKIRLIYSAYAIDHEKYGKVVSGIDEYGVPLADMFDFLYEQIQNEYVTLDDDMMSDIDDIHDALEDGKKQLQGEHYSRLVLNLLIPEEGEETFEFLNTVRDTAKKYYGNNVTLAGNATSDYDLSATFGEDNVLISILSVLFVVLVLLFTFQSAGIPLILILVIQGSVWINFSFPYLEHNYLFFLSYLVVSSIQMGANIDYAIVITNRYTELKTQMPIKEAIIESLSQAFPTIFTSGSILACAGFAIGLMSSDAAISSIGICLGRGTLISIVLVMGILPQLLLLGDFIIEKTSFEVKGKIKRHTMKGNVLVDGHVHGYINGRVDGVFQGRIKGDFDASVLNGNVQKEEEEEK